MLADSDPRRRRVTATLLRLGGFHVSEAERLADIPAAGREGVDVLVTEAQLADGDAVAYAARVRQSPSTAALPIVVTSSDRAVEETVRAAMGEGVFLLTPAKPSALLGRIQALLTPRDG